VYGDGEEQTLTTEQTQALYRTICVELAKGGDAT
jgi:hypothetical protein